MGLPGVKVGPMDPDTTSEFGQVAARNSARQLIRLHQQLHPPELKRALARPLDEPRTKGLDLDEVQEYVEKLKLENGDPILPDGSQVLGAAVRGDPLGRGTQVLTFTFGLESGRVGKWYAPYGHEALPDSYESGAELARVKEMKDRGVVAFDSEGTHTEILRRQLAESRRETAALRAHVEREGSDDDSPLPESSGDTRNQSSIASDNERLGRENVELKERVAQLEAVFGAAGGGVPVAGVSEAAIRPGSAADNEPFEGYDDLKADEVAKRLRSEDTSDAEREAILTYELRHANRKTVVLASEQSLAGEGQKSSGD